MGMETFQQAVTKLCSIVFNGFFRFINVGKCIPLTGSIIFEFVNDLFYKN